MPMARQSMPSAVAPPAVPLPETICQTPNSATIIARLRTQPGGSRIQTQAMMAAMNGAVLWITRISATVACFSATTKESEAEAKQQATTMLEKAPQLSGDSPLNSLYEEHLVETREHAELIKERLDALGGDPSSIKDAAMRMGALNWGGFFAAHPDTAGKLAAFTYAFEHLEIGGYEQLKRVARRAGDETTASIADRILDEERTAARRIEGMFDAAVTAALDALGVAPAR